MADERAERNRAIDLAIASIEKQFGKGSIMRLGEAHHMQTEAFPTGSLSLDIALGVGGVPRGRITEIYGPESSGKTTICQHIVAEAQRMGGVAAFVDMEHALDPVYAARVGVDIDNLLRAKAAIYAGFNVLAQSVGTDLSVVERVLVGGSFGQYINVEKAVQLGLLPDLPWEKFQFLGNTAVSGAYMALLARAARSRLQAAAGKMTYLELSADNSFYEAFTSALFLPHTDLTRFPSVAAAAANGRPA